MALNNPKISVLLPVFNCELFIKDAVDSIINQTFSDFELLIIDDASTDNTISILKLYQDPRIQLIQKPINTGYTNSLNYGLNLAKGEYIARMDGDDICAPNRFEKQIEFLNANFDTVICGTCFKIIETNRTILVPENNSDIKLAFLKGNCIAHPSVMMRKSILDRFSITYNISKEPAEDYDLWVRILGFGEIHNLPDVLLYYRIHHEQVSYKHEETQAKNALETRFEILKYLNCSFSNDEYSLLMKIMQKQDLLTFKEIEKFAKLKGKMINANSNGFFNSKGFQEYLTSLQTSLLRDFFSKLDNYSPVILTYYCIAMSRYKFKLETRNEFKLIFKSFVFYKRI